VRPGEFLHGVRIGGVDLRRGVARVVTDLLRRSGGPDRVVVGQHHLLEPWPTGAQASDRLSDTVPTPSTGQQLTFIRRADVAVVTNSCPDEWGSWIAAVEMSPTSSLRIRFIHESRTRTPTLFRTTDGG
jgi:hypothetical protein